MIDQNVVEEYKRVKCTYRALIMITATFMSRLLTFFGLFFSQPEQCDGNDLKEK